MHYTWNYSLLPVPHLAQDFAISLAENSAHLAQPKKKCTINSTIQLVSTT